MEVHMFFPSCKRLHQASSVALMLKNVLLKFLGGCRSFMLIVPQLVLHTILRFKWCFVAISVSRTLFQSPFFVSDCGFFPSFPLLMHALYCLYLSSVICPVLCPRFHLAATRGHLDCLNLILGHNVDVTATDASGEFCLD